MCPLGLDATELRPTLTFGPFFPVNVGIYDPNTNNFYLDINCGLGCPTINFGSGLQMYPVVGDWGGVGYDTIGVYNQSNGQFLLRNSNTAGTANEQFVLGNPNDQPIAGRWQSGIGPSGVGVFRPSNGLIYLKNALTTGYADYQMVLGVPGDVGLAGDWTNKGFSSPGVYRPSTATFYESDQVCNCAVYADYSKMFGAPNEAPVVGDWTGSHHSDIGIYDKGSSTFYLKYWSRPNSGPYADSTFLFKPPGNTTQFLPIAGKWVAACPVPNPQTPIFPFPVPCTTPTPGPSPTFTPSKTLTPTVIPTATGTEIVRQSMCNALYTELLGDTQPYGIQTPSAKAPFTQKDVVPGISGLRYYTGNALPRNTAYPDNTLHYFDLPGQEAIPCQLLDPNGNPIFDGRGNPVIRFAGPDNLRVLNYADYFAFLQPDWCSPPNQPFGEGTPVSANDPGGDVFNIPYQSNVKAPYYNSGYNVPPEGFNCSQIPKNLITDKTDPCVTLIASVYRAMHYFNLDIFFDITATYNPNGTISSYYPWNMDDLFYDVGAPGQYGWEAILLNNTYYNNHGPKFISHAPIFNNKTFTPMTVYLASDPTDKTKRIYVDTAIKPLDSPTHWDTHGNGLATGIYMQMDRSSKLSVNGQPTNYLDIFNHLNIGDLIVTVVEQTPGGTSPSDPTKVVRNYTHIQMVVGWGPVAYANYNDRLYSSCAATPKCDGSTYVPYVIDRDLGGLNNALPPTPSSLSESKSGSNLVGDHGRFFEFFCSRNG
ncbi:MAG: hypothetical protein ACYDEO_27420 [Aggregatilineales bacterium]